MSNTVEVILLCLAMFGIVFVVIFPAWHLNIKNKNKIKTLGIEPEDVKFESDSNEDESEEEVENWYEQSQQHKDFRDDAISRLD